MGFCCLRTRPEARFGSGRRGGKRGCCCRDKDGRRQFLKKASPLFSVLQPKPRCRKGPVLCISVVRPELLFLSTSCCPLRLGRGLLCDNPQHPRMPEASPLDSVKSLKAVDMGFSLRSSSLPVVGKALLRGFGSPLGGYAPCGVFLRAMPRPAKLSRCRPHRQLTTYDNLLSPRLKNHLVYR